MLTLPLRHTYSAASSAVEGVTESNIALRAARPAGVELANSRSCGSGGEAAGFFCFAGYGKKALGQKEVPDSSRK